VNLNISPIKLSGPWKAGFALDAHTISSEYRGDDEYGHPIYDTKRSEIGELLFRLKYRSDRTAVKALAYAAAEFIRSRKWPVEVIVMVPPTKSRPVFQPLAFLARATARFLEVPVVLDCVVKVRETPELKTVLDYNERIQLLNGAYAISTPAVSGQTVLLIDDLYRSGATLEAAALALERKGKVKQIYVLTFTKTRRAK
jgi:competence protein ComFC